MRTVISHIICGVGKCKLPGILTRQYLCLSNIRIIIGFQTKALIKIFWRYISDLCLHLLSELHSTAPNKCKLAVFKRRTAKLRLFKINIMCLFCISVSFDQPSCNMTHGTISGAFTNALCRLVIFRKVHFVQELINVSASFMPNNI